MSEKKRVRSPSSEDEDEDSGVKGSTLYGNPLDISGIEDKRRNIEIMIMELYPDMKKYVHNPICVTSYDQFFSKTMFKYLSEDKKIIFRPRKFLTEHMQGRPIMRNEAEAYVYFDFYIRGVKNKNEKAKPPMLGDKMTLYAQGVPSFDHVTPREIQVSVEHITFTACTFNFGVLRIRSDYDKNFGNVRCKVESFHSVSVMLGSKYITEKDIPIIP